MGTLELPSPALRHSEICLTIPHVSIDRRAHGPTIRAIRIARGLRSDTVAAAARISNGYLSNIEAGRRHPEAAKTAAIADALRVPVEVITGQKPAIATLREALGISTATFARDVGLTLVRLDRIERGAEHPNRDLLAVIVTRLGVDPAALRPYIDISTTTRVAS